MVGLWCHVFILLTTCPGGTEASSETNCSCWANTVSHTHTHCLTHTHTHTERERPFDHVISLVVIVGACFQTSRASPQMITHFTWKVSKVGHIFDSF